MKTFSTLLLSTVIALSALGCGDNLLEEADPDASEEVIIIPHQGKALTALESAESIGFVDPLYFSDAGVITAFGDMEWAEQAKAMPGIADVVAADGPLWPNTGDEPQAPISRDLGKDNVLQRGPLLDLEKAGNE